MTDRNVRQYRAIDEVVRAFEYRSEEGRQKATPKPRVITISRERGSGGRRIAEALAQKLNWPLWDKEILDVLASQSQMGYQARMFEALDEKSRGAVESMVGSFFGEVDKHVYLYLLPQAILTIAQHDAIILGRGAYLILPESLRIRVEASPDTRVRNLVTYDGCDEHTARETINQSDLERGAFIQDLTRVMSARRPDLGRNVPYDLALNTDGFDVEQATAIALSAAKERFGL